MIKKAKKASVPNDNIERARKRGSGEEAGGADWENIMYEGYGPNGVAMLIECLTDNRNRAATEVRTAMSRNEIGRASCRERVNVSVETVSLKDKEELSSDNLFWKLQYRACIANH